MKAYEVHICNSAHPDDGAVYREFFVFADNFVDATMYAAEALEEVKKAMSSAGICRDAVDTVEIESVALMAEVIGKRGLKRSYESSSENDREDFEPWAKRVAERVKKDRDS